MLTSLVINYENDGEGEILGKMKNGEKAFICLQDNEASR